MGIDRVGKNGVPAPSPEASGPSRSKEATSSFVAVESSRAPNAPVAVDAAHVALERFRGGQIDLHGYLDLKVDEATAHLSALPRVELDAVRAALRDRLATDPALVELVRTATGKVPEPPEDP
jgi:hypothetical protein